MNGSSVITVFRLLTMMLVAVMLSSCAHKPPEGAIPGRISVISTMNTTYQDSWINHYVPRGINDYAHYQIVDGSTNAPYKLEVTITDVKSYVAGFVPTYNGTRVAYRTRIEFKFTFSGPDESVVLQQSGWSEHNSESDAIYVMAKFIGKALSEKGMLAPSFYTNQ